jgi:DNA-binding CsgD family transcriptional regulator
MTPPRRVLGTAAELAAALEELRLEGWRVHQGFALPDEPWELAESRMVLAGEVASEADARAALLGAVRGAGLAVRLDRGRPWAATFLADLDRLDDPAPVPVPTPADPLTAEQRQILDLLAGGASIAQAARRLFVSLRTANRRVAAARAALGVTTTREAVLAYVRLRAGSPLDRPRLDLPNPPD